MYNPFKTVFYERRKLLLLSPEAVLLIILMKLIDPNSFMGFVFFLFVSVFILVVISYIYDIATGAHKAIPPRGMFKGKKTPNESG